MELWDQGNLLDESQYAMPNTTAAAPGGLYPQTIYIADAAEISTRLAPDSVALVVTSPPYFNYKDYGETGHIGSARDSYHQFLEDLTAVLVGCFNALIPGGKACINLTNMKSRAKVEGRTFMYPVVADTIKRCQQIGFDLHDEIIWIKGGANAGATGRPLFGSYPYPPNFKILDSIQEPILVFQKPGKRYLPERSEREKSRLSKEEWKEYTYGVWNIPPERQNKGHPAVFPLEIPLRLIKLYSFVGETVLDPFLGSGTTLRACRELERCGIGFEINPDFLPLILQKVGHEYCTIR